MVRLFVALGIIFGAQAVSAHHSFGVAFDATRPITVSGVITVQ